MVDAGNIRMCAEARCYMRCCLQCSLGTSHITEQSLACRRVPGLREVHRWSSLTAGLVAQGWSVNDALSTAWQQVSTHALTDAWVYMLHAEPLVHHRSTFVGALVAQVWM